MYANNIQFTKIEIQLIRYIFKHFRDRYNARQLARILSLNHAHLNKLCNELSDKKLLIKEDIGNSVYYRFDYENELALKFMEYILSLEKEEFPGWLTVAIHELRKFTEHIELGLVFGSSIKSETFNDIDILLVYDKKKKAAISKIKEKIRKSELLEKPVRYMEMTKEDISKSKDDEVIYSILSENLIFHDSSEYIKVIRCLRN